MFKQYFKIQLARYNRALDTFGIHPILGKLLIGILFLGFSKSLFYKLNNQAIWIYLVIFILTLIKLSNKGRIEMIERFFIEKDRIKLRITENSLVSIPFTLCVLYENMYLYAWIFPLIAILLSFLRLDTNINLVIPTPFKRIPFENIVGFRRNSWIFLLLIGLYTQGLLVSNYNIGIGVQGLLTLVFITFYFHLERGYEVWIFRNTAKEFLLKKIMQGIFANSLFSVPIALLNTILQPKLFLTILIILLSGYLLIVFIIVAKYSMFPIAITLPHAIILILCIIFPPLLLVTIPYFYLKAIKSLKPYLHD